MFLHFSNCQSAMSPYCFAMVLPNHFINKRILLKLKLLCGFFHNVDSFLFIFVELILFIFTQELIVQLII